MCLNAGAMNRQDPTFETMIPVYRCGEGEAQTFSIMPMNSGKDYKARAVDVAQPIMAGGPVGGNQGGDVVTQSSAVRRLTPTECERLQGFPDGYTLIPYRGKPASDGPRYKALGNSMAVPVMRWIGERISIVDKLT
jgi:DNA (cytosine-5)-methyltransferase 1